MNSFFQTQEGRKRMVGGGALMGGGITMEMFNDHHGCLWFDFNTPYHGLVDRRRRYVGFWVPYQ